MILVLGNIIIDHIWEVNSLRMDSSNESISYTVNYGGVHNYINALEELETKFTCHSFIGNDNSIIESNPSFSDALNLTKIEGKTAQASIIAEVNNNVRSSIVEWGIYKNEISELDVDKNVSHIHIAYIDTFRISTKFIKELCDKGITISSDFCGANIWPDTEKYLLDIIPYVSTFCISLNHYNELSLSLKKILSDKEVIIHDPEMVQYINSNDSITIYNKHFIADKKLNVLGAGDYFTSCILNKTQFDKEDIAKSINYAQEKTAKWLKAKNQKLLTT